MTPSAQYIRHYTQPGDLVLDPFCGSGGTALAALMEGRKAIAIDRSPAATFITKNYCTPVDPDELQPAFEELQAQSQAGDGLALRDPLRPLRRQGNDGLHRLFTGLPMPALSGQGTAVRLRGDGRADGSGEAEDRSRLPALSQATGHEETSQHAARGSAHSRCW